jgi:hypothetical protein
MAKEVAAQDNSIEACMEDAWKEFSCMEDVQPMPSGL